MPIDVERALGAELEGSGYAWTEEDLILYNLGVGAGDPPTDAVEIGYAYEGDLRAIPTYGTVPPFELFMSGLMTLDGLDISLAQVLHGEQELVIHGAIPTSGKVMQRGKIIDIYDKGSGALVVLEVVSTLERTGDLLFTNRSAIFVRGEGGFGGERGPAAGNQPPGREPDHVVASPTLPQQALLYRLASGDRNPLHADPGFAAFAGYEKPILHGLCTFGVVGKAVLDHALGSETSRFKSFRARFRGHVFPGETIVTRIWETPGGLSVEASVAERSEIVLSNAIVEVGPSS